MNIYDASLFTSPDCLPCCTQPADCSCALLIPPFSSPYADYATAETAIADQTDNCLGYYVASPVGDITDTFTTAFDGTTLEMDGTQDSSALPGNRGIIFYASVSLLSGAVLSVAYTITTDGTEYSCLLELLDCSTGDVDDSDTLLTSSGTLTVTAPADGEYVVKITSNAGIGATDATYITVATDTTCSSDYWVNPVIALWDDSGTTRKLWACPKLLLPPLTESTGTWYADCAAAAADITDKASNCVGFFNEDPANYDTCSFTATDGGTSLDLDASVVDSLSELVEAIGWFAGVNCESGETISIAWSFTASGGSGTDQPGEFRVLIYDDAGVLVEDLVDAIASGLASGSGTLTSSALPYTGRYTLAVSFAPTFGNDGITPATYSENAAITSSGVLSVNPIQAFWDAGLTCPATLNCGDSC